MENVLNVGQQPFGIGLLVETIPGPVHMGTRTATSNPSRTTGVLTQFRNGDSANDLVDDSGGQDDMAD